MKNKIWLILPIILLCFIFSSCIEVARKEVVRSQFRDLNYAVIPIKTGEYTIDIISSHPHLSNWCTDSGAAWGKHSIYGKIWMTYSSSSLSYCECCDSCYRAFQRSGLIKYKIIEEDKDANLIKVNVELTKKGEKYIVDNDLLDAELATELERGNFRVVLLEKEVVKKIENVTPCGDAGFDCDVIIKRELTPFGDVFGKEINTLVNRGNHFFRYKNR